MTLPVPNAVADASLDAAILLCLARYPGQRRYEIEDDRTVAPVLAQAPSIRAARSWLIARMRHLRETGQIEKHTGRHGWFVVASERSA